MIYFFISFINFFFFNECIEAAAKTTYSSSDSILKKIGFILECISEVFQISMF